MPLSQCEGWTTRAHSWPKLWKHHGAEHEAAELTALARSRAEPWLRNYSGIVGAEWLLPKALEIFDADVEVFHTMALFLEAGDWVVWMLCGELVKSSCQAGYKACFSPEGGYPCPEYLNAVRPGFEALLPKLTTLASRPIAHSSPGQHAGFLRPSAPGAFGRLAEQRAAAGRTEPVAVSVAMIDAHAAALAAGADDEGVLVMVLGTSVCHMLNSAGPVRAVPGVCGAVLGGIREGLVGYETGQAAAGDMFNWLQSIACHSSEHGRTLQDYQTEAASLRAGCGNLVLVDFMNGCRTPLMRTDLTAVLFGLTLSTTAPMLYRAMAEAIACGARSVVENFRRHGVHVKRVVLCGGLPSATNGLICRIIASVLAMDVLVSPLGKPPPPCPRCTRASSSLACTCVPALPPSPALFVPSPT